MYRLLVFNTIALCLALDAHDRYKINDWSLRSKVLLALGLAILLGLIYSVFSR